MVKKPGLRIRLFYLRTTLNWILLLLGGAAAFSFAYFTYFRREPGGRGRVVLMGLRSAALILIILLLIDPQLGASPRTARNNTRVVLDASLSMRPRAAETRAWERALQLARQHGSAGIVIAGDAARSVSPDSLTRVQPTASTSRMLPALQAAAEAGAQRVVLVTDGAIDDAGEIARWLPRLGLQLDVERVEMSNTPNRAIAELEAPSWAEAGKPLQIRVGVTARALSTDQPVNVVVRQRGNEVARAQATIPTEGRTASVNIAFNANGPPEGGLVRYDIAFETRDSIPDDDVRSAYVFVSEEPAGVAIVSFLPDWEPRFLHPVLAQALGLPVRTFLRVPNGSYFRGGDGLQAGTRVDEAGVRRALAQADLVVLHGVTENAPAWWRDVAARSARLLLFPAEMLGDPYEVSRGMDADWYVSGDVPPSPIAGFLQGLNLGELPPLETMFSATPSENAWTPLHAGRSRRGGRNPVLFAQEAGNRRTAIALGTGYWRWAFRGGDSRDLYTRLWGALAGWLTQDQAQVAGAAIRPVDRTVARGAAVRWIAPGIAVDSLQVQLTDASGRTATSTIAPQRGDTALTGALAPGHYNYAARAFAGGREVAQAGGPLTVESYSPEFMDADSDLSILKSTPAALAGLGEGAGRPLHAYIWPYVILILLLCAEWIFRRRWGLR
jgi:hypothetical protein